VCGADSKRGIYIKGLHVFLLISVYSGIESEIGVLLSQLIAVNTN
jgi:hypothetical protein